MRQRLVYIIIAFAIMIFGSSCNCDDYKSVKVQFCLDHPEFIVTPVIFDTITEQVLAKEGYNEGATFETVTEQVLACTGYTRIKIMDIQYVSIETNAEDNTQCEIPCINYFSELEFELETLLATYETRSYQKVVQNGTGALVAPQYQTRTFIKAVEDANLYKTQADSMTLIFKRFNIPIDMDFDTYLNQQLEAAGAIDCGDLESYKIIPE